MPLCRFIAIALVLWLCGCNASFLKSGEGASSHDQSQLLVGDEADLNADLKAQQSLELGLANIPAVDAYLEALIKQIQAAGPKPAHRAKVVIRPRLSYNANTLASGLIIIDLGWLKNIDSEAELVALLAHEYGHLVNGHLGTKNIVGTAAHIGLLGGLLFTGSNKLALGLANEGWVNMLLPNWSRNQEFEADANAINITQAMGYAYVPSVKAFLDRIQSIEKSAQSAVPDPKVVAKDASSLSDDHPTVAERLSRAKQLVDGLPRVRPKPRGADGWRKILDSKEFASHSAEYMLVGRFLDVLILNKKQDLAGLANQLAQRPVQTAAGITAKAVFARPDQREILLKKAIDAKDASFMPYALLVHQYFEQGLYEKSSSTMWAGIERFDAPPHFYPYVVGHLRRTQERIAALPVDKKTSQLDSLSFKSAMSLTSYSAKCTIKPEYAEACAWAGLSEQQRLAKLHAQQQQQDSMNRQVESKVSNIFKK